jgi:hypothetical protein
LQLAEHGEVDPDVLAALPQSMQRNLLAQVSALIYAVMGSYELKCFSFSFIMMLLS